MKKGSKTLFKDFAWRVQNLLDEELFKNVDQRLFAWRVQSLWGWRVQRFWEQEGLKAYLCLGIKSLGWRLPSLWVEDFKVFKMKGMKGSEGVQSFVQRLAWYEGSKSLGMKGSWIVFKDLEWRCLRLLYEEVIKNVSNVFSKTWASKTWNEGFEVFWMKKRSKLWSKTFCMKGSKVFGGDEGFKDFGNKKVCKPIYVGCCS